MITISANGLQFLKEQEGFHPTPTRNYKGVLVIGYGHPVQDPCNPSGALAPHSLDSSDWLHKVADHSSCSLTPPVQDSRNSINSSKIKDSPDFLPQAKEITEEEACRLLDDDLKMPIKEVRQAMQFVQLHSFFGNRLPRPSRHADPSRHAEPEAASSFKSNSISEQLDSASPLPDYSWLRSFSTIQNRFDALLSIRFTMTFAEFKATDMMRAIYDGAPDATILHHLNRLVYIDDPDNPGQRIRSDYLVTRRQQEAELFFD